MLYENEVLLYSVVGISTAPLIYALGKGAYDGWREEKEANRLAKTGFKKMAQSTIEVEEVMNPISNSKDSVYTTLDRVVNE